MNLIKYIIMQFRPRFWNAGTSTTHDQTLFNYRRFWFFSILLRALVSLVPVAILFIFTYILENRAIKNENHLRAVRLTSNTRRTISFFLEERLDALRFIMQEKKLKTLKNDVELFYILRDLQMGFGGFVDLGLIDDSGLQINYTGPFHLKGRNYGNQGWFIKSIEAGAYVSDVFLGYRNLPHMIVALKWSIPNGSFYILRATLDIRNLIKILSSLELSLKSEAFLCNREGLLQTPSKYYGDVLKKLELPIPEYSRHSQVMEAVDKAGNSVLIGYAYIENSPYILMLVKRSKEIMKGWYSLRKEINWIFGVSAIITLFVVLGISTFMVNRIYDADQTRLKAMQRLESSSRLISVGSLAAGVAHEINNPLAVINENAGLIKDLFTIKKEYKEERQLMELIDAVLESVERGGEITRQLLGFARVFKPEITPLQLNEIVSEVLTFFRKEASYRNIGISVSIPEDLPVIYSDHGSLQQIFFNLINNAFQAMNAGGRLDIFADKIGDESVTLSIKDTGPGIPEKDQRRIFEPFYTTRNLKGGTGLGLSITHNLVRKLRGDISVHSELGVGTTFVVSLPIAFEGDIQNESLAR